MELFNYEERFFWKKIYHAAIKAGKAPIFAKDLADAAIAHLRQTPVVRQAQKD